MRTRAEPVFGFGLVTSPLGRFNRLDRGKHRHGTGDGDDKGAGDDTLVPGYADYPNVPGS